MHFAPDNFVFFVYYSVNLPVVVSRGVNSIITKYLHLISCSQWRFKTMRSSLI